MLNAAATANVLPPKTAITALPTAVLVFVAETGAAMPAKRAALVREIAGHVFVATVLAKPARIADPVPLIAEPVNAAMGDVQYEPRIVATVLPTAETVFVGIESATDRKPATPVQETAVLA